MTKEKAWDYFILVSRFLIGITFISYGYSKLTEQQFGLTVEELNSSINQIDLFRMSWYLFDHQPFKFVIGTFQIITGLLLLINRTVLLGAFMFLPIVIMILIIDLTFMSPTFAYAFAWRLSFYILLNLLIIWHYKERIIPVWQHLTKGMTTKYKFHWLWYLLIPIFVVILEIIGALPKILFALI